jgi:hypothetical protein
MNQVVTIKHNNSEIALPCEDEQLGEFISSLLGQPQSIEKFFRLPFEFDHTWAIHLISLIEQRLYQQNEFQIVSFQSNIKFKDKTQRKLSSIEAFKTYAETLNVVSIGLSLNFSILVKFPKKELPEKQEINISFDSESNYDTDLSDSVFSKLNDYSSGLVSIEITHTERTWADDMMGMLEKSLDEIWTQQSKLSKTMRFLGKVVTSDITYLLLLPFSMIFVLFSSNTGKKSPEENLRIYSDLTNKLTNVNNQELLNRKIDFLTNAFLQSEVQRNIGLKTTLLPMILIVSSMALLIILKLIIKNMKPYPSFVLLTKNAYSFKNQIMKMTAKANMIFYTVITLFLGMIMSIVASYIYAWMIK